MHRTPPNAERDERHNYGLLDAVLGRVLDATSNADGDFSLETSNDSSLHIMSILRNMRLRNVYSFPGRRFIIGRRTDMSWLAAYITVLNAKLAFEGLIE